MLRFDVFENKLAFSSGGWLEPQPTRYEGEPWDWIAVELACGIADPFPDVGLLVEAKRQIRGAPPLDAARWTKAPLVAPPEKPAKFLSLACSSGERDYYIPSCREAFEEIVYHYQPSLLSDKGQAPFELAASTTIFAFPSRSVLLEPFTPDGSRRQCVVSETIQRLIDEALFELYWNAGTWMITARSADVKHLAKLADPVVSRINCAIIEC